MTRTNMKPAHLKGTYYEIVQRCKEDVSKSILRLKELNKPINHDTFIYETLRVWPVSRKSVEEELQRLKDLNIFEIDDDNNMIFNL